MKVFICCLILFPFTDVVQTDPITDTQSSTTDTPTPANITACINSLTTPVTQIKPEAANSEAKSAEKFNTNPHPKPDVPEKSGGDDLDSRRIITPESVRKVKSPLKSSEGANNDDMLSGELTSRQRQDVRSPDHSGPEGDQQASPEQADLDSAEEELLRAQGDENVSGGQSANGQRRATPGDTSGMNERLNQDSLENHEGRDAGGNSNTDYDETREFMSSETQRFGRRTIRSSFPAKSQEF